MPSDIYSLWKTNNHGNLNLKLLRATTSEVAKLCKVQKVVNFTHFNKKKKKNTHISACKIVHIYKSVTVTMYICTVIVALHLIFYYLFLSSSPHSLFCIIERINKKM